MTDIEQGLKEAIETATRGQRGRDAAIAEAKAIHGEHGDSIRPYIVPSDPFTAVRVRTRGALVAAHQALAPHDGWSEADDRMLDMLTAWLDNVQERRP